MWMGNWLKENRTFQNVFWKKKQTEKQPKSGTVSS